MVFVVERQTTKLLPMKQYRIVTITVLFGVHTHTVPQPRKFFYELAKNSPLTKILPPQKYPLYGMLAPSCDLVCVLIVMLGLHAETLSFLPKAKNGQVRISG